MIYSNNHQCVLAWHFVNLVGVNSELARRVKGNYCMHVGETEGWVCGGRFILKCKPVFFAN